MWKIEPREKIISGQRENQAKMHTGCNIPWQEREILKTQNEGKPIQKILLYLKTYSVVAEY